jgi:hypothetical protein
MSIDYIPTRLALYRLFSDHFVDLVLLKAALWGITDVAKTKLTDGHAAWTAAQNNADNPDSRTSIAVEKASRLHKEDVANIRWTVRTYINPNALGTVTVEDRLDLGLHVKNTSPTRRPAPKNRPNIDVEPSGKFQHKVTILDSSTNKKAKLTDAYGVRYAWRLGGDAPDSPTDLPKSKFNHRTLEKFNWDPGDQGKRVHFAAAYENSRGDQGPWSVIVSSVVS